MKILLILLCLGTVLSASGTKPPMVGSTHAPLICNKGNNTIGTCACDTQLWINEDCTEGFYCNAMADAEGCGLKCTGVNEIIIVDPRTSYWECVSMDQNLKPICPGAFHIDCPCPSDEECGFGACDCDGQLWISENCNKAKHCDSSFEGGSKEYTCPAGQIIDIIDVNNPSSTWRCIKDDGRCPGAFHVGCQTDVPPTEASTTTREPAHCSNPNENNTLGTCDCEQQLWISDDCREGFFCDSTATADGCSITCQEDEFLIVDTRPEVMSWECIPRVHPESNATLMCPGAFHVDCPCKTEEECAFGNCECDGQLWVSEDCMKARYCNSRYVGGMRELTCPLGHIVDVDTIHQQWSCIEDDGRCPGAFHVGCEDQTTSLSPSVCEPGNNTLGTCTCDHQLWIGNNCREGFFCLDETMADGNEGCHITCAETEVLIVDPRSDRWDCVDMSYNDALHFMCPGDFHIDCPCEGDEECGFGECACEGQLWISEDCRKGKYCGKNFPDGHLDISCPPSFIVQVDPVYNTWKCIPDDGRCPGAFHVGCPAPLTCREGNNTLGTCTCNDQLWISDDCTEGFYCSEKANADGCGLKCTEPDEIIIVDPRQNSWECKSVNQSPIPICPGAFHIDCPCESDEACGFGSCDCDGQLWVSTDCRQAKHCDSSFAGGSKNFTCPSGKIIDIRDVNNPSASWRCINDDGRCPGAFHVGCQTDFPPSPPTHAPLICNKGDNTIGTCACDEQLWINEDCTEGFYCNEMADAEGCGLKCTGENEIIVVDPRTDYWECVSMDQSLRPICPGAFHIDCPCPSDEECGFGSCDCDGQLWISENCNKAKHCDSSFEGGSKEYTCPAGQIVDVTDVNNPSSNWRCIKDDGRCPGAFHYGCQTDPPTSPTTTTPDSAAGKSMYSIVGIFITILLSMLF